ncbi:MAG TPA: tetratricopeptide repeat protein, partial [Pirellulales bacterium]|nr:tetratricopeptide repeat protein [Pirellulales bacterium]
MNEERTQRLSKAAKAFELQRNEAQLRAAQTYLAHDHLDMCREQLDSLLSREPNHREANFLLLTVLIRDGDLAEARSKGEALAERWPEDADIVHALGQIYELDGNESGALACFERAASLATNEPSSPEARRGLPGSMPVDDSVLQASLLKAEVCLALDRSDDALKRLEGVLMRDPDQPEAHLLAGRAMAEQGNAIDAVVHYESASGHAGDPDNVTDVIVTSGSEGENEIPETPSRWSDGSKRGPKIVRIAEAPITATPTADTPTVAAPAETRPSSRQPGLFVDNAAQPLVESKVA